MGGANEDNREKVTLVYPTQATHVWNDDGEFGVQRVVHLPNCSFVTPEGVVILAVFGVRVTDGGEDFIPGGGVGIRLRHTVWRLPAISQQDPTKSQHGGLSINVLNQNNDNCGFLSIRS